MSIIAARIDNRLLHGIVATQWTSEYRPQRVMIIDEEYANDPTKKAAMRMAKPAGVALSIIALDTARANFKSGKYDDHSVFLVVRDPGVIAALLADGQRIPSLVVGGTVSPDEGVQATQVGRRAYVTGDEEAVYREIHRAGTDITVQYVPSDAPESLSNYIEL